MPAVHTLKCWFLIVLAGALCYLNALGNGFVFDDSAYLSSSLVHQFRPLAMPSFRAVFTPISTGP